MTAFISHTSIDCRNAYELSEWWKKVLEYVDDPDDANEPGHDECWIQRPDGGHPLLFIEVPEGKSVKNRLHLDLRVAREVCQRSLAHHRLELDAAVLELAVVDVSGTIGQDDGSLRQRPAVAQVGDEGRHGSLAHAGQCLDGVRLGF